ncbi:MAG: alpha/beta fold hydrolase [Planctomycetota bacterium]|nr:MAG: alpha/beta fold hydrolase [Planctomycetota bacterium]
MVGRSSDRLEDFGGGFCVAAGSKAARGYSVEYFVGVFPRFKAALAVTASAATVACAQHGPAPAWRQLVEQFEQTCEELLDKAQELDDVPEPMVGIYVPRRPGVDAAGELPSKWVPLNGQDRVAPKLVLLVHGLDEPGDIWCDLAPALVEHGYAVARFEYPNDQHVVESATRLLESLRQARSCGVEEIVIVAHSMGGLVSFDALTRADGYAGDVSGGEQLPRVTRLIAVGTPWKGSPWARLRVLAEVREQVQRWMMDESWDIRPLLRFRNDGLGEAAEDLSEESELIRALNERAVPEKLSLTIIAGRMAPEEKLDVGWIRESRLLRQMLGREGVEALLDDLAEARRTLGDGVVPIESALARATGDVVILDANHRGLLRRTPIDFATAEGDGKPPAIEVILDRLRAQDE